MYCTSFSSLFFLLDEWRSTNVPVNGVDKMKDDLIVWDRERPRKNLGQNVKRDLDLDFRGKWSIFYLIQGGELVSSDPCSRTHPVR